MVERRIQKNTQIKEKEAKNWLKKGTATALVGIGVGAAALGIGYGVKEARSNDEIKPVTGESQTIATPTTSEAGAGLGNNPEVSTSSTTTSLENLNNIVIDDREMGKGEQFITPWPSLVQGDVIILDEKTGKVVVPYDNDARTGQMTYVEAGTVLIAKYGGDAQGLANLDLNSELQKRNLYVNAKLMLEHGGVEGQGVGKVFVSKFIDGVLTPVCTITKEDSFETTTTTSTEKQTSSVEADGVLYDDKELLPDELYTIKSGNNIVLGDIMVGGKDGKALYDNSAQTGLITIIKTVGENGLSIYSAWGADIQMDVKAEAFKDVLDQDIQEMKAQHSGTEGFRVIVKEVDQNGKVLSETSY